MNSDSTLITGIAPEHFPALLAALAVPLALWFGSRRLREAAAGGSAWAGEIAAGWHSASLSRRVICYLLLSTGVIHLALPLGHNDAPVLTVLFLAAGGAFVVFAVRSLGAGRWRGRAAFLLLGSIGSYLVLAGSGWQEEPDQVGIATKLLELTALGLIMIPGRDPAALGIKRHLARPAASLVFVSLTVLTGLVIWVGSFVAHGNADASAHEHEPGTPAHSHGHEHAFAARAQAGVIMRPTSLEPPTLEQVEAAARLAEETRTGAARYQDYDAALADGYAPDGPRLGVQRHLKNAAYQKDGLTLDTRRPELLVYATDGERHLLLGVAYTMEKAGQPGPEIGGPLTRWHTHNICFTLLPPGFGLVSPFGTCPLGAVAVTLPEMIHVWTVDNPGGPYAERLEDGFVKQLLAESAP